MTLPFLPGYSFEDRKKHYGFEQSLQYNKGVPLVKPIDANKNISAIDFIANQNKLLDDDILIELTYGPKRPTIPEFPLPPSLAFDKKVLRFFGYIQEDLIEWAREVRIRPVKVLYYLQDDTMEVIEPKIPNSGLPQGLLIKRQKLPRPNGKGYYRWKDLNIGIDLLIYGKIIHLTNCDEWTKEYLTSVGLILNDPEPIPKDEYLEMRQKMNEREEFIAPNVEEDKVYKFLNFDKKVLKFYGIWDDTLSEAPDYRKVILQYYLADDMLEILEVHAPNDGRDPCSVLVRKQKIPIDRYKLPASFPLAYLEINEDDLDEWFKPEHFQLGKEVLIYGRKILLYDCDKFTRNYYKAVFGKDMEPFEVALKSPEKSPKIIIPPHTGIGTWEDSIQSCLSLIPQPPKKDFPKALHYVDKTLRFFAQMDTSCELNKGRKFVITLYLCDDTVSIFELHVPNSGFMSGTFLKRCQLKKGTGPGDKPIYYEAKDFYIGAKIEASGRRFIINDADKFVLKFMEANPDIYPEECIKAHREKMVSTKLESEPWKSEKDEIIKKSKENVINKEAAIPYPIPETLELDKEMCSREEIMQKLFSADLPISQKLINKVLDICTDNNGKVDVNEVKRIILPSLGHKIK